MRTFRSVFSGAIVWTMIFTTFALLGFIPVVKSLPHLQSAIVAGLLLGYSYIGISFYYKKGSSANSLIVGLIMSCTALTLDALITVPFVVIPGNGSYMSFYTNPILWIYVMENMAVVFAYWYLKVKPKAALEF